MPRAGGESRKNSGIYSLTYGLSSDTVLLDSYPAVAKVPHKDQRLWAPTPALSALIKKSIKNKSGIKHTPFQPPDCSGDAFKKWRKGQYQTADLAKGPLHRPHRPREYAVRDIYSARMPDEII